MINIFYFENLIKNEYFPAELPPCFDTQSLAKKHQDICGKVNATNYRTSSIPLTFSGFKSENSRRKFAIPNPYHYFKAIDCIVKNSEELFRVFEKSKTSLSCPLKNKPSEDQAYSKRSTSIAETKDEIEKLYQNNLYSIKLDIMSFFDSIYTHTIPWAIYSKNYAKQHTQDKSLFGNNLDFHIRNLNHSQTNGVLVGNALSRIISEIILTNIDRAIQEKFSDIEYRRYVDDYFIFLKDASKIQSIISFIRFELGKYELTLNENKIEITESPFVYGKPWVEEIKLYIGLDSEVFLTKVINVYKKYKDISILRYGLKVISLHDVNDKSWASMESKLLNLWTRFPSLSNIFVDIFWGKKDVLRSNHLKNVIYSIIDYNIPLNNHQEIIWAVWCIKVFDIKISLPYISKIIESRNTLAIIILLDIIQSEKYNKESVTFKNLLKDFKKELESEDIDTDGTSGNLLWSQEWLLAYEADINGWLNIEGESFEYARNNGFFKKLMDLNIHFYKRDIALSEVPSRKTTSYITKAEFLNGINKLKNYIDMRISTVNSDIEAGKIELDEEDKNFIRRLKSMSYGQY